jgi:hypothetical protein
VKKAETNKVEIVAKLQAAAFAAQDKNYKSKQCPVMDEAFDPKHAINVMHGTKLVKLCCDDCLEVMNVTPNKFAAMIPAAAKAKSEGHGKERGGEHGKEHGGEEHDKKGRNEHDKKDGD